MKRTLIKLGIALVGIAVALGLWLMLDTPAVKADPTTTDEVCGAFNLGLSPEQIIEGLQRNDHRNNYWKAQRDTVWPIIEGDCG